MLILSACVADPCHTALQLWAWELILRFFCPFSADKPLFLPVAAKQ